MRIAFTECRRRKRQEAACDREHGQRPCQSGDGACKESKSKTGTGRLFGGPVERRREVYGSENFLRQQGERAEKLLAGCRYETVTDEVMRHMSDTQTPQGILAVAEQFSYQISDVLKNSPDGKAPELVILETLQDPGNLGTILRAGEGAGVTGIILDRGSADIYSPKVIRSTMGSIYRVPFIYTDDLHQTIGEVKKQGIRLYAAHLKGKHNYEEEN